MSAATAPTSAPVCKRWLLSTCLHGKKCELPHVALPEHFLSTATERGLARVLGVLSTQGRPAHCAKFFSYQPCHEMCEFLHLFRKHQLSSALQEELAAEEEEEEETEEEAWYSDSDGELDKAEVSSAATRIPIAANPSVSTEVLSALVALLTSPGAAHPAGSATELKHELELVKIRSKLRESELKAELKAKLVKAEYEAKMARLEAELARLKAKLAAKA